MDAFPKFIIEDGAIVFRRVKYHKDIVTIPARCVGGGWFRFHAGTNTFVFFGDSTDFGKASFEDVKACVNAGRIYSSKIQMHSFAEGFNWAYDTGSEVIVLEVNEMPLE